MDKFKHYLKTKDGEGYAFNTMATKLSHVRTYLKEGFDVKVNVKLGKVNKSQKNPHKAYRHDDILELVKQLRN